MRILIITPLYPPDIKEPAPYVKEFARRFSSNHTVTILAYNHIPEKVDGVTIVTVEKSSNVLVRLFRFFVALTRLAPSHDVLYVQNGPSVELPVFTYLIVSKQSPKTFFRLGDHVPLSRSSRITQLLAKRVTQALSHDDTCGLCPFSTLVIPRPLPRPEILPFEGRDVTAEQEYQSSWNEHMTRLHELFVT